MARPAGLEPATLCLEVRLASSTVFHQLLPLVALTQLQGVCFRSQRPRLALLMGEFSDSFLTVVAAHGHALRAVQHVVAVMVFDLQ